MSEVAIQIEELSKKYTIGSQNYWTLRHTLSNLFKRQKRDEFWALDKVSFNINKGDSVGLIGRNGAGKSTLLKVLSKITYPTSGVATLNGRVASLLEVGTGFHAELSGRENIYLNGSILGMTKSEIKLKFDEIVEFSGIGKFIDTPVKHYSSGMYVRLAFSVAAHLDSDILLVDEVLAVGDYEFQQKCLQKINSSLGEKTVLFVSHDMDAIRKICKKTVWIEGGKVREYSDTIDVINAYLDIDKHTNSNYKSGNLEASVQLVENPVARSFSEHSLKFKITNATSKALKNLRLDIGIDDINGVRVGWVTNENCRFDLDGKGSKILEFQISNWVYKTGKYSITTYLENMDGLIEHSRNSEIVYSQSERDNISIVPPSGQGSVILNYKVNYSN